MLALTAAHQSEVTADPIVARHGPWRLAIVAPLRGGDPDPVRTVHRPVLQPIDNNALLNAVYSQHDANRNAPKSLKTLIRTPLLIDTKRAFCVLSVAKDPSQNLSEEKAKVNKRRSHAVRVLRSIGTRRGESGWKSRKAASYTARSGCATRERPTTPPSPRFAGLAALQYTFLLDQVRREYASVGVGSTRFSLCTDARRPTRIVKEARAGRRGHGSAEC